MSKVEHPTSQISFRPAPPIIPGMDSQFYWKYRSAVASDNIRFLAKVSDLKALDELTYVEMHTVTPLNDESKTLYIVSLSTTVGRYEEFCKNSFVISTQI